MDVFLSSLHLQWQRLRLGLPIGLIWDSYGKSVAGRIKTAANQLNVVASAADLTAEI